MPGSAHQSDQCDLSGSSTSIQTRQTMSRRTLLQVKGIRPRLIQSRPDPFSYHCLGRLAGSLAEQWLSPLSDCVAPNHRVRGTRVHVHRRDPDCSQDRARADGHHPRGKGLPANRRPEAVGRVLERRAEPITAFPAETLKPAENLVIPLEPTQGILPSEPETQSGAKGTGE